MIACGFDGSPYALEALEVASALSRKLHDKLVAIRVEDFLGAEQDEQVQKRHTDELRREVARMADDDAEVRVLAGAAVEGLLDTARDARLLVVGARGLGRRALALRIGSVANALVTRASTPLLVVRDARPFLEALAGRAPLRVLLAVDTHGFRDALALVTTWSQRLLLDTRVLHVTANDVIDAPRVAPFALEVVRSEQPVEDVIAEHAQRQHAGLVVVARKPARLLSRSRAKPIAATSTTNVLAVPPPGGSG